MKWAPRQAKIMSDPKQELLRNLPSVTELLKSETVAGWLQQHPQSLVTDCLRRALAGLRQQILDDAAGRCGAQHITADAVLSHANELLQQAVEPRLREAINATGIILHTGLGRAVFPGSVVDSMMAELEGLLNAGRGPRDAASASSGTNWSNPSSPNSPARKRRRSSTTTPPPRCWCWRRWRRKRKSSSRAASLSRSAARSGCPEVMAQSQARLVEVGATNRTHLKDYRNAITENTAAIMRVHPSNYRVVGFTSEVPLAELAELAHSQGLILIDDLGAGALLDLEQFGLPHEPTVRESIEAGADVVLFSGDKLIGASQSRHHRGPQGADRPVAQASADAGDARGQDLPAGAGADAAPVPRSRSCSAASIRPTG